MLLLTKWVAEKPPEEIESNLEDPPAVAQVATRAQRKRQDLKEQKDWSSRTSNMSSSPALTWTWVEIRVPPLCNPTYRDPWNSRQHWKAGWWTWAPSTTSLGGKREFPLHLQWRNVHKRMTRTREETERPTPLWPERVSPVELREMNCLSTHWKKPGNWQTKETSATHGREVYSWGSRLYWEARSSSWCRTGTGMKYYTSPTVRQ